MCKISVVLYLSCLHHIKDYGVVDTCQFWRAYNSKPTWLRKLIRRKDCLVKVTYPQIGFCPDCQEKGTEELERLDARIGEAEKQKDHLIPESNPVLQVSSNRSSYFRDDCTIKVSVVPPGEVDNLRKFNKKNFIEDLHGEYMVWQDTYSSDDALYTDLITTNQTDCHDENDQNSPERFETSDYEDLEEEKDSMADNYDGEGNRSWSVSSNSRVNVRQFHNPNSIEAASYKATNGEEISFSHKGGQLKFRRTLPKQTCHTEGHLFKVPDASAWFGGYNIEISDMSESFYSALSNTSDLSFNNRRNVIGAATAEVAKHLGSVERSNKQSKQDEGPYTRRERQMVLLPQNVLTDFGRGRFLVGGPYNPFGLVRTYVKTDVRADGNGNGNGTQLPKRSSLPFTQGSTLDGRLSDSHDCRTCSTSYLSHGSASTCGPQPSSLAFIQCIGLLEDPFISPIFSRDVQADRANSDVLIPKEGGVDGLLSLDSDTLDVFFYTPGSRLFSDEFNLPRPPIRTDGHLSKENSLDDPWMSPRRRARRCTHSLYGFDQPERLP